MAYKRETIVEKNITLSFEFERYLLEHPELLDFPFDTPKEENILLIFPLPHCEH